MGFFSSNKNKEIKAIFNMVEGIPSVRKGTPVTIRVEEELMTVTPHTGNTPPFTLPILRITGIGIYDESQLLKKMSTVNGQKAISGLLLGDLEKYMGNGDTFRSYLLMNYDDQKVLSFEAVSPCKGYTKLFQEIRSIIK